MDTTRGDGPDAGTRNAERKAHFIAQVMGDAQAARIPGTATCDEPLFAARDSDMRDWPDDELTVGNLVGTLKDMGCDDDPFVVTTEAGARIRLLGVRRLDPVGAVDLVVDTPEPVLSYADVKIVAAGDPAAVKAMTDLAGQLFRVRGILARVLESETTSRQGALEEIARILGD